MMDEDGATEVNTPKHAQITTANFPIPSSGHLQQVAPGIFWLRMPLPFKLDHINLYLLEDGDGWTVIDCGLHNTETLALWQQIEDQCFAGKPVNRVIATHAHVDHLGAAGALCQRWQAPLWISQGEFDSASSYLNPQHKQAKYPGFFMPLGINQEKAESLSKLGTGLAKLFAPLPEQVRYLQDQEEIAIGQYRWQILLAEGHCAAHAVLYCAEAKILISGDQVLPGISSNVSVRIDEPEGNPLHHWLEAIDRLLQLDKETLVLPAHERPFSGLHARLMQLKCEHHDTLELLTTQCSEAKNVFQLLNVVYQRELSPFDIILASGECLAHLHYLLDKQQMRKTVDEQGHYLFQTV
ncbi:MBL fold metallo-hydrolase [Oceanospirillum beijerinckii]|uniref:MBL fold metallo-hydrolase n=1 Tax=Oceanospirillum beijerinckii TaxID=64976 RepID=UPI0004172A6C|nr:MBL fold metallo-hydrolase [Oceanospirillum beijerinckii]